MPKPHLCPKCHGECQVQTAAPMTSDAEQHTRPCPVCKGAGVLWEPPESVFIPSVWQEPYNTEPGEITTTRDPSYKVYYRDGAYCDPHNPDAPWSDNVARYSFEPCGVVADPSIQITSHA